MIGRLQAEQNQNLQTSPLITDVKVEKEYQPIKATALRTFNPQVEVSVPADETESFINTDENSLERIEQFDASENCLIPEEKLSVIEREEKFNNNPIYVNPNFREKTNDNNKLIKRKITTIITTATIASIVALGTACGVLASRNKGGSLEKTSENDFSNNFTSTTFNPESIITPTKIANSTYEHTTNIMKDFYKLDSYAVNETLNSQLHTINAMGYKPIAAEVGDLYKEDIIKYVAGFNGIQVRKIIYDNVIDLIYSQSHYNKQYDDYIYKADYKFANSLAPFDIEDHTLEYKKEKINNLISTIEEQFLEINNGFLDKQKGGKQAEITELKAEFKLRYEELLTEYLNPENFYENIEAYNLDLQVAIAEYKNDYLNTLDHTYHWIGESLIGKLAHYFEPIYKEDNSIEKRTKDTILTAITPYLQKTLHQMSKFSFYVESIYALNMRVLEMKTQEAKVISSISILKKLDSLDVISDEQHQHIKNLIDSLTLYIEPLRELIDKDISNTTKIICNEKNIEDAITKMGAPELPLAEIKKILDSIDEDLTTKEKADNLFYSAIYLIRNLITYGDKDKSPLFKLNAEKLDAIDNLADLQNQTTQIATEVMKNMTTEMAHSIFDEGRLVNLF